MMIRPMMAEDMDAVLIVENACFTDPWSRKSFEDSLNEPSAHLLVMAEEAKEEVAGYCCLYHALDEGEIVNVAVAPEYRQKGYGGELVRALMTLGASLGEKRFFLEVRAGNTAGKRLYGSLGFEMCGRRKGFYTNPKEDAVVMMWEKAPVCQ